MMSITPGTWKPGNDLGTVVSDRDPQGNVPSPELNHVQEWVMSIDLDRLMGFADRLEAARPSQDVVDRATEFAEYTEKTVWHREARELGKVIANRFRAIAKIAKAKGATP